MQLLALAAALAMAMLAAAAVSQPAFAQATRPLAAIDSASGASRPSAPPRQQDGATAALPGDVGTQRPTQQTDPAVRPTPQRRVTARPAPAPAPPPSGPLFGFNLFRFLGIPIVPRTTVAFTGNHKPGTIIIHTDERRLYYVLGNGEAIRYGVGVGRDGFRWKGVHNVTMKREWPSWTPPPQMLARKPELPRHMPGGRDNPLGARAMYLGDTLYRIYGTNEYDASNTAELSGCFRMNNDDVIDLYNRVQIGATVIVR